MTRQLLTTAEAATELGVIPRRVRQLAEQRSVGQRFGRMILFTRDDLDIMRPDLREKQNWGKRGSNRLPAREL